MPEGEVGTKTDLNHSENNIRGKEKYQTYSAGAGKQYSYEKRVC